MNSNFLLSVEDALLAPGLSNYMYSGGILSFIDLGDSSNLAALIPSCPALLRLCFDNVLETLLKLTQLFQWKSAIMGQLYLFLFVRQILIVVVCPTKRNHF